MPRPECGTRRGYNWHLRHQENPCDECKAAEAAYRRQYVAERRLPGRPAKCGTRSGYQRHLRLGETPCEPCRLANTEYKTCLRRAPQARPPGFDPAVCQLCGRPVREHTAGCWQPTGV